MTKEGIVDKTTRTLYGALTCRPGEIPGSSTNKGPYPAPKVGPDPNVAKKVQEQAAGMNLGFYVDGEGTVAQQKQQLLNKANAESTEERRRQQEYAAHCR